MDKELSPGQMEVFIMETITMIKENNMEKWPGATELLIKESGKKASNTDVVLWALLTVVSKMVFGKLVFLKVEL